MPTLGCSPFATNILQAACELLKGGIAQEIFVANLWEIAANGITYNGSKEVTAITMKVNPVTDPVLYNWFRIVTKKQSSGVENIPVIGTNTKYFNQEINFVVPGLTTTNKTAFEKMLVGQAVFIAKDSDDIWHIIGEKSGAEMIEGRMGTGIELDALVGMEAKFQAQENFVMRTVVAGTTISVLEEDGVTISTITL